VAEAEVAEADVDLLVARIREKNWFLYQLDSMGSADRRRWTNRKHLLPHLLPLLPSPSLCHASVAGCSLQVSSQAVESEVMLSPPPY
jgi:hypothetical protein